MTLILRTAYALTLNMYLTNTSSSKTIYFRKQSPHYDTLASISLHDKNHHYYFYCTITLTHHHHTLHCSKPLRYICILFRSPVGLFSTISRHFTHFTQRKPFQSFSDTFTFYWIYSI
jgi:hypothetical protein